MNTIKNDVSVDQVAGFAAIKSVSGSYMQNVAHANVSAKYQTIQAASVGLALGEKNFTLVSSLTGKGRQSDKIDHQRTISRYRSSDVFEIDGLQLDIIYISKHMGRGCDEIRLGLYRGACANQWAMGTLFNIVKVRHNDNALIAIQQGLSEVLSQRQQLIDTVKKMQSIQLTGTDIEHLARKFTDIRLEGKTNIVDANWRSLAKVHRDADAKLDLFTVANVLQENIVRMPLAYRINSQDANGAPMVRNQVTRQLKESSAQLVDLNARLFDAAMEMVA